VNIFVGNLLFEATEADVKELFAGFGEVASVAIVMEKKGLKSRGFGFVEMPNEEEAKSAIAALNGKDFMGRVINVSPSIPKTSSERDAERKKKRAAKSIDLNLGQPQVSKRREHSAFKRFFPKPGTFKGGRRTRSYVKRQEASGVIEPDIFRRKPKENPMRWLKRRDQPRPWEKSNGEAKPWQKNRSSAKPWEKKTDDSRPLKKYEGEARPWQKNRSSAKPWEKRASSVRPWKRAEGEAKPWRKSSDRQQQRPNFKARNKPSTLR